MDWFEGAIRDEAQLRDVYEESSWLVENKQIDHLDQNCRDYLAACGFVVLASSDAHGRADVTPRGGPRGFVSVLDDRTIAIPDATGNRRIDTLRNVVQTGRLACGTRRRGRARTSSPGSPTPSRPWCTPSPSAWPDRSSGRRRRGRCSRQAA